MAADPSIDPCRLVKKAEVEQIIGRPTGDPTSERNDRVRMCTFLFSSDPSDALELWLYPGEAMERIKKEIKELSPIAGLGQEAFLYRDKKFQYVRLFVKKGNAMLEVWLNESAGDDDKVKAIAKKALGRFLAPTTK
ncbi:MAG: hypothetical protein ABI980_04275 [Nitrospirota bacterium]